jgi:hypothetical protein
MLAMLDPFSFDAWISFRGFLHAQFDEPFRIESWFAGTELASGFLARSQPVALFLGAVAAGTFFLPNTQQVFARFEPVLGVAAEKLHHRASLRVLDWRVAVAVSALFVFSVLQLGKVSPFLYFQF